MDPIVLILIVVVILALTGGGMGYRRYGSSSFGLLGVILVVILIWYLFKHV